MPTKKAIEKVGNKEKERKCGGACGKIKNLEIDFPKAKNASGYSYWCKECSLNKSYFDQENANQLKSDLELDNFREICKCIIEKI